MADEKVYLSKEKLGEIERELEDLRMNKRKEIAERLEYAKSLGDLSENAEYHQAREEQVNLEQRIAELKSMIKNAEIIERHHADVVEVGATVVVQKKGEEDTRRYEIVGSEEADMSAGKISHASPLGEALMKRGKGDTIVFDSPGGKAEYTIKNIE